MFKTVIIPGVVHREMLHSRAPSEVRAWAVAPPPWLELMHDIGSEYPTDRRLHAGELAAIALAVALKADLVLMEDRAGAVAARANGLNVTGTLGVLDLAARIGLADLDTAFERLKATNFRYRPAMLDDMLMDWRESRGQ